MKKRVKLSNSNPYYSNEPAVSRAMIADKPGVPGTSAGAATPKMVDKRPGRLAGIAGFTSKTKPKAGIHTATAKLGSKDTKGVPVQGKLKASGHAGAHQVGLKKLKGI